VVAVIGAIIAIFLWNAFIRRSTIWDINTAAVG
jgi:hypothetical protein